MKLEAIRAYARAIPPAPAFGATLVSTFLLLRFASTGALHAALAFVLVPLSVTAMVGFAFAATRSPRDAMVGYSRPLHRRHGFWVVAAGVWLLLPRLGSFGLTDPWETHYAEVAREMIARRDLISPWWAHDGLFTSKPVLIFWMEALAMRLFGVHVEPDRVLASGARLAHPEWAVRLPAAMFAILGAYFFYKGIARACGRRGGLIAALALLASPGYALIAHQAITDMPLVGGITAAMGLFLIALSAKEDELTPRLRVGSWAGITAGQGVALAFTALLAPQILYLLSRHVHVDGTGLHFVRDSFFLGSPKNCTLPGQPACVRGVVAHPALSPAVIALLATPALAFVASRAWKETRLSRVAALAAFLFAALATMAKGPAGFAIPLATLAIYAVATRSFMRVLRLELVTGALIVCALTAPWYLAAYARHGKAFTDELVFRHMLGRTLDHLHDTNGVEDTGIRYYVWQLGYALFPWSGVALAGLFAALRGGNSPRARAKVFLAAWALLAFGLVSAMHTKFHHYMLPVLPPLAALAGLYLDEASPRTVVEAVRDLSKGRARVLLPRAIAVVAAACVTLLIARDFVTDEGLHGVSGQARLIQLFTYRYDRGWPQALHFETVFMVFAAGLALSLAAVSLTRVRLYAVALFISGSMLFAGFALDVYLPACAPHWGQRPLFDAYYAARGPSGPEIVAYQMNWKGENFYTGNRVAIFVSSGAPMKAYLDQRRARGESEVYFVTEHERVGGLRAELGAVRSFEQLTTRDTDRQFCLVRALL